jgi:hypothetical protein
MGGLRLDNYAGLALFGSRFSLSATTDPAYVLVQNNKAVVYNIVPAGRDQEFALTAKYYPEPILTEASAVAMCRK